MVTKEYAMAYTEVMEILSHVPDEDVAKIPKEKLEFYKQNMDKEYKYQLDFTKEFEEQQMSDIAKAMLANIFKDYWATPYQRERIIAKEKYDLEKIEEEKRKTYNPNDIFKKVDKRDNIEINDNKTELIEYKESFFKKLKKFILGLLHIDN